MNVDTMINNIKIAINLKAAMNVQSTWVVAGALINVYQGIEKDLFVNKLINFAEMLIGHLVIIHV